jgi:hypothetical protein
MAEETISQGGNENGNTQSESGQGQQVQPPSQTQAPSQSQSSHQSPPFIAELKQALDSLPERIALAVKEATPQQTASPAPAAQSQSNAGATAARSGDTPTGAAGKTAQGGSQRQETTTPAKRTFAQWWFGQ